MANPGLLALDALNRILTGTTGDKCLAEQGVFDRDGDCVEQDNDYNSCCCKSI